MQSDTSNREKINTFRDPHQVTGREKGEVQGCQEESTVTS